MQFIRQHESRAACSTLTREDGSFRFPAVAPGRVKVRVYLPDCGGINCCCFVSLEPGRAYQVEIRGMRAVVKEVGKKECVSV